MRREKFLNIGTLRDIEAGFEKEKEIFYNQSDTFCYIPVHFFNICNV